MKVILLFLLVIGSFASFAQAQNTSTYYNYLTVPGMCENGKRTSNHRMNCVQWLKVNYELMRVQLMLTDMPMIGKVIKIEGDVMVVYIPDLGKKFGFSHGADHNITEVVTNTIWYKRSF